MVDQHIEQDKEQETCRELGKPIDSDLLRSKVKELNSRLDKMDKVERKQVDQLQKDYSVVADAGYGSEQNYEFMEGNHIDAFVKYNYFHKEQKRA